MSERNGLLGIVAESAGYRCAVEDSRFKGKDSEDSAYYYAECSNGGAFLISIQADAAGSTRVLNCNVANALGLKCKEDW